MLCKKLCSHLFYIEPVVNPPDIAVVGGFVLLVNSLCPEVSYLMPERFGEFVSWGFAAGGKLQIWLFH